MPDETRQALQDSHAGVPPADAAGRALVRAGASCASWRRPCCRARGRDLAPTALDHGDGTIPYASFGRLLGLGAAQGAAPMWACSSGASTGLTTLRRRRPDAAFRHRRRRVARARRAPAGQQRRRVAYLTERPGVAEFGYAIYQPGVAGAARSTRARGGHAFPARAVRTVVRARGAPSACPAGDHAVAHFHASLPASTPRVALRFSPSWLSKTIAGVIRDCSRPRCRIERRARPGAARCARCGCPR